MFLRSNQLMKNAFAKFAIFFLFNYVFLCLVFLCPVFGNSASENNNSDDAGYNVVLIVITALRADHLGCYGYSRGTSVNIDKLAKEGIIFKQAITQSFWTLPSLVSILTSKFVIAHNVNSRKTKLDKNEKTLAEILKIYGYNTAAFTCGLDTSAVYGVNRGFDTYSVYQGNRPMGSFSDIMPQAVSWLGGNKKFFLFLQSYDVHPPYNDYREYSFDKDYKGIFDNSQLSYNELKGISGQGFYTESRRLSLEPKDIIHIISRYDDCIKYADGFIGRFIEELKRLNLYDKTIIILAGDHGEELGERGTFNRFGNQNLYQEVIRVPLIIKYPSIRLKTKKIDSLVETVDIMPTILDLLHIPIEHNLQGKSLVPLIEKDADRVINKYAVAEASRNKLVIVRNDGWKLLYSPSGNELYNINVDPLERNNLIGQKLDVQVSLMKELFFWRQRYEKEDSPGGYINLSSESIEKLREAGYW